MNTATCHDPSALETLVAYWLGELSGPTESALEEHLFGCAQCTRRLDELVALAAGVRAAVKSGKLGLVVAAPFVAAMRQAGLRLREYRLGPGGSVNCTIAADDDAVVAHIRAPLTGVARLDLVSTIVEHDGEPETRMADVPFNAETGEVLMVPPAAWLKSMPAFTMQLRLVAVGATAETPIGVYTFNHSPS